MVKGLPATMGSRHFAGHVSDADAACVTLLREAGAVIVGMTNTHEFAYGPTGDRSAAGPARNPRDTTRMPGGSSSGSAVAVAAGMVPLALGTDTGGSVRIPAALSGATGFKPAYGALPADGVFPLSKTLDHVGLLARDAQDCLVAYRALVPGHRQPRSAPPGAGRPRVAWFDPGAVFPCDPRVVRTTRQVLEAAAGPVPERRLSRRDADDLHETFVSIQSHEVIEVHAGRMAQAPGLFDDEVLERLRAAATVPARRYARAMRARTRLAEAVRLLFGHDDVLAMPTVPITAPELGRRELDVNGTPVAVRDALLALTSPWNVLGLPALSIAAGTVDGLPVGLQLVCRPGREHLLFQTAALCTSTGEVHA
ncbi:amidase [Nonomuraea roseoviolacea subsp. roseoviolacea]